MNHQPFENWLLSEEPLTAEQSQALQEHLRVCDQCCQIESSWESVHTLFQEAPVLAPAPGFTARWQERQAELRRKRHQKQSWTFLLITGGIAAVLLGALGVGVLGLVKEPDQLLIFTVYRMVTLLISLESAEEFLATAFKSLTGAVPLTAWIGLSGLASMLSVLWIVLFKRLSAQRRMVQ